MAYRIMIKDKIRQFANTLGIETIGFSKDAVVTLFPYYVRNESGNVSMYARGIDYHNVGEEKLKRLSEFMVSLGARETLVHVDKGGLDDRKAAFEAGLGFFGKNGLLINEKYGSYFFIGQLVHDLSIEADNPVERECLSCGACIRNCPGGALSENGFELDKCLSEISQKKGELTAEERILLKSNGLCWGCDTCQKVCPHNEGLETTAMPEFMSNRINALMIDDVENLSNREFKDKYGEYAFSWRGKTPLTRNLRLFSEKEQI